MALFGIFWIHSGIVRAHQYLGERDYRALAGLRRSALDVTTVADPVSDANLQRVRRSRDHLESVEQLGLLPTQGNAWRLTWLYFLTGSPADFSVAARQAIDRGEYPAEIHQLLALEALREGDSEFAIAALESAIEVDPNRVQPHVNLGLALVEAGRLEAAGSAFERGLQYLPRSHRAALQRRSGARLSG